MTQHVPVLLAEVLAGLAPPVGGTIVDGTLGGGGHARALADAVGPGGLVIGLDRDRAAVERATSAMGGPKLRLVHANYRKLRMMLDTLSIDRVDGVLLDLGLSSDQLADAERGFSFAVDGPLDLRYDTSVGEPAWRLLERLPERDLADLIYRWGEERYSRRIARAVVESRRSAPLRTSGQLADLVRRVLPRSKGPARIDPATRTFQALRIAVNDELGALGDALQSIPDCLAAGGRVAIISFHSLEDRMVKNAFRGDPRYQSLNKKPIVAGEAELSLNPRARSAKLRVAARTAEGG